MPQRVNFFQSTTFISFLVALLITPVAQADKLGAIYPKSDYCDCSTAVYAAERMLEQYKGKEVAQILETTEILEEIKASRIFTVTIESKHDASLRARITWEGSPWKRLESADKKLSTLETILPKVFDAIGPLNTLRSKLKGILEEARKLDPKSGASKWMLPEDALEIIKKLHRETKTMVKNASQLRDQLYCEYGLPRELSLIAAFSAVRKTCFKDDSRPKGYKRGMTLFQGNTPKAGNLDFYKRNPDNSVFEAIGKCSVLGIQTKPLPLNPVPQGNCPEEEEPSSDADDNILTTGSVKMPMEEKDVDEGAKVCADPETEATGSWKYYRQLYGGGGTAYRGTRQISCHRNNYWKISSSQVKEYTCKSGYTECAFSKSFPVDKTASGDDGKFTIYYSGKKSWGTFTPK